MVNIDYFQLPKLYLHSAMYISVPKSEKMSYIFATPGDLANQGVISGGKEQTLEASRRQTGPCDVMGLF